MLDRTISAVGCSIFSPDGEPVGDLMLDEAGLVFGHIELERPLTGKLMHNIIGHYIRPAIFGLVFGRAQAASVALCPWPTGTC